jgi:hypothetical protein
MAELDGLPVSFLSKTLLIANKHSLWKRIEPELIDA